MIRLAPGADTAAALRDMLAMTRTTQADLSRATGIGESPISAYLAGHKTPTMPLLLRLLAALGVDMVFLPQRSPQNVQRPPVGGSGRPGGAETISGGSTPCSLHTGWCDKDGRWIDCSPGCLGNQRTNSCTCALHGPDPACVVHEGRKARGPKPPTPHGCICDGSGRTCPRHGAVI